MLRSEGRRARLHRVRTVAFASLVLWVGCKMGGGSKFPGESDPDKLPAENAAVRTLNEGYQRTRSKVLVREIERPTRATLDYAAYHANFMIADAEPEGGAPTGGTASTANPFKGVLDKASLTGDVKKTPLTDAERRAPLAFPPLVQFLQSRKVAGAEDLDDVGASVRSETWGLPATPGTPSQSVSEVFLHAGPGGAVELWAKVEFQPWFKGLGSLSDQDRDGYPELYGKVRPDRIKPAVVELVQRDYVGQPLGPAEVKAWANQLSSYWYPSFNTDLIPAGASWPDDKTEADIKGELGGHAFNAPTIVLRGKPQGKPTYEVFLVKTGAAATEQASGTSNALKLARTKPTPDPRAIVKEIEHQLGAEGQGSFPKWAAEVAPYDDVINRRLKAAPPAIKGFAGADGFLFYRRGMEYTVGGDLESQRPGKNPVPIIVEFKKLLEAHGVDFLFVPVPTKEEIFPDKVDPKFKNLVGRVANPYSRKLLLSLADKGIEVIDLLPTFLSARAAGDPSGQEPLYQKQDTHWTDRGLRMAADVLTARIKKYPWYAALAAHAQTFTSKDASFTRFGDLQSRLPEGEKRKYKPETLAAHQVMRADGKPYDDDPDSPIVLLGDSFTGVYELTDAEHAGVSAHIAKGVSYPLDLVMSYGGGPNVRQKLMRRGADALDSKKLVIWMMTVRDLYDFWENWEPLSAK